MSLLLNSLLSGNHIHPVQRTLAQVMVESPVTAKAGAVRQVTDYGGTIAVSDGTRWRLERLTCNWTDKPAANAVPVGTDLRVLDYNNVIFWSDGTYWRPRGAQNLYHKNGLVTSPIASLSGVTAGLFALPTMKIPAGLIVPNSKLSVQVSVRKTGANSTANIAVYLGTTNSSSGSLLINGTMSATTLTDSMINCAAKFGTDTQKFITQNSIGEGVSSHSSTAIQVDRATNINTAANMFVNIGIASANTSDSFEMQHIRVTYEA